MSPYLYPTSRSGFQRNLTRPVPQVWNHFLTCTDEKQWKTGKRRAEKDELVGANFFMALKVPDKPLSQGQM